MVVSVGAKAQGKILEQVGIRKTNESEPIEDTSLQKLSVVKPRNVKPFWEKSVGCLMTGERATGVEGA